MNGTTNFMLSKMEAEGAAYEDVLKEAQDLGFAEGEPGRAIFSCRVANRCVDAFCSSFFFIFTRSPFFSSFLFSPLFSFFFFSEAHAKYPFRHARLKHLNSSLCRIHKSLIVGGRIDNDKRWNRELECQIDLCSQIERERAWDFGVYKNWTDITLRDRFFHMACGIYSEQWYLQ